MIFHVFLSRILCNASPSYIVVQVRDTVSLWLCDTSGAQDVHINESLITADHAVYHKDAYTAQAVSQTPLVLSLFLSLKSVPTKSVRIFFTCFTVSSREKNTNICVMN